MPEPITIALVVVGATQLIDAGISDSSTQIVEAGSADTGEFIGLQRTSTWNLGTVAYMYNRGGTYVHDEIAYDHRGVRGRQRICCTLQ